MVSIFEITNIDTASYDGLLLTEHILFYDKKIHHLHDRSWHPVSLGQPQGQHALAVIFALGSVCMPDATQHAICTRPKGRELNGWYSE